jgi:thermostable 8-oxoguanine DNA glycosylase
MAKKQSEPLNLNSSNLPGGSSQIDKLDFNDTEISVSVDQELVQSLQKELGDRKKENRDKLYAISMSGDLLDRYEDFINNEAEWNSTEALGIVEVHKQIKRIKSEKIKDGVIYMGALPIEATHYFLNKVKGKGFKEASEFLQLYKSFDQSLKDVKGDNQILQDLEKKLAAAMQGISLG